MSTGVVPVANPFDLERRFIGRSPKLIKLIAQVKKLATVRTPVLLIGESGTGKTAIVEILHGTTGAPESCFVRIDCSLSSELDLRDGLIGLNGEGGTWVKQAKGGTLYLQHLECLSASVQKQLVSVLRNTAHCFRLVCTSNVDLEKLVDDGRFHDELFYRVASLPISLPPLREYADDIKSLVKHYSLQAANPVLDPNLIEFTDATIATMAAYRWPGNLTELRQVVSQIVTTTQTRVITPRQLPLKLRTISRSSTKKRAVLAITGNKRQVPSSDLAPAVSSTHLSNSGDTMGQTTIYPFLMGGLLHNTLNNITYADVCASELASTFKDLDSSKLKKISDGIRSGLSDIVGTLQLMQRISRSYYAKEKHPPPKRLVASLVSDLESTNTHIKYGVAVDTRFNHSLLPYGVTEFFIRELLRNATKACCNRQLATIYIEISVNLEKKDILFKCKDSGCGFPEDVLTQVRLQQLRLPTSTTKHGHGLFLMNELALRMRGQLLASNAEDGGAQVQILVSYELLFPKL
jgi:hypothetical protein